MSYTNFLLTLGVALAIIGVGVEVKKYNDHQAAQVTTTTIKPAN